MWHKLKQSLGLQKSGQAQAKSGQAQAKSGQAQAKPGQAQAKPDKKTSLTSTGPANAPQKDPKEAALDLERDAVRASFQSDPQTVVAVIRAWLHEDAKKVAEPKEDAKPKEGAKPR